MSFPISFCVIPAKAGIQTGFSVGPALDYDRGLGMTEYINTTETMFLQAGWFGGWGARVV